MSEPSSSWILVTQIVRIFCPGINGSERQFMARKVQLQGLYNTDTILVILAHDSRIALRHQHASMNIQRIDQIKINGSSL
jgi:hypothetical protein